MGIFDDIVDTAVNIVVAPIKDANDVLDGLTEGELRIKAAAKLGADVAAGMALSEILEVLQND